MRMMHNVDIVLLETLWAVDKFGLLFLVRCNKIYIRKKDAIAKIDEEMLETSNTWNPGLSKPSEPELQAETDEVDKQ